MHNIIQTMYSRNNSYLIWIKYIKHCLNIGICLISWVIKTKEPLAFIHAELSRRAFFHEFCIPVMVFHSNNLLNWFIATHLVVRCLSFSLLKSASTQVSTLTINGSHPTGIHKETTNPIAIVNLLHIIIDVGWLKIEAKWDYLQQSILIWVDFIDKCTPIELQK